MCLVAACDGYCQHCPVHYTEFSDVRFQEPLLTSARWTQDAGCPGDGPIIRDQPARKVQSVIGMYDARRNDHEQLVPALGDRLTAEELADDREVADARNFREFP